MEKTQDYAEYLISKINETVNSICKMPGHSETLNLSGDRLNKEQVLHQELELRCHPI